MYKWQLYCNKLIEFEQAECGMKVKLSKVDERVARQLLTVSRRIQTYKLQLYSQLHRDIIDCALLDLDDVQPSYVDLDVDRTQLLAVNHLMRCGITRSHLQPRRRFSIF